MDLDDPETQEIIAEAIDDDKLDWRGKRDDRLAYAPTRCFSSARNTCTEWSKRMCGNGRIWELTQWRTRLQVAKAVLVYRRD
mgnify:CR=1 FL=1